MSSLASDASSTPITSNEVPSGYPAPRPLHGCPHGRYDDKVVEEEVIVRLPPSASDGLEDDEEDGLQDWWLRGTWSHPVDDDSGAASRRQAIIIVHGLFSWRNQMLIEGLSRELSLGVVESDPSSRTNYVKNERVSVTSANADASSSILASSLQSAASRYTDPVASSHSLTPSSSSVRFSVLRIDLRGNGSSPGQWSYANPARDIADLRRTVRYVSHCYSYLPPSSSSSSFGLTCSPPWHFSVACIVGHSAGSRCVMEYIASHRDPTPFVNLAGRYHPVPLGPAGRFSDDDLNTLRESGRVEFKADYLNGRVREGGFFVTADSIAFRGDLNMPATVAMINEAAKIDVERPHALTVHGGRDDVVPFNENAKGGFGLRPEDGGLERHAVVEIERADHNFNGAKYLPILAHLVRTFVELSQDNNPK